MLADASPETTGAIAYMGLRRSVETLTIMRCFNHLSWLVPAVTLRPFAFCSSLLPTFNISLPARAEVSVCFDQHQACNWIAAAASARPDVLPNLAPPITPRISSTCGGGCAVQLVLDQAQFQENFTRLFV